MLYQVGSVKIGEVVRYTVTYTPSHDRILPSPEFLYLRIRNSSAIALRAAFVHGPYTLSVAAYPSTFNPNNKFNDPQKYGVPEFEPMLKAGGTWSCHLVIPADVRQSAGDGARQGYFGPSPEQETQSVTWVIDVASQVVFSTSAAVHYEILVARDEKSLTVGSAVPVLGGQAQVPSPGKVSDYQKGRDGKHPEQPKGVFTRALRLKIEDTATLWNTPQLPGWDELGKTTPTAAKIDTVVEAAKAAEPVRNPKKVHLIVLTHGLHSNLGADLLFLKESIDAGVKQAKIDRKARKAKEREARKAKAKAEGMQGEQKDGSGASEQQGNEGEEEEDNDDEDDEDDEEVIVRGFSGNATKTERGIKYLGKRLAKYILSMTYPDQPFQPTTKAASDKVSSVLHGGTQKDHESKPSHKNSSVHQTPSERLRRYKITKISFIGHSLGGLVQTYAVAYIQKHSPTFFDVIKPVNFICLATPLLGLNHENPVYVKFALDFGLVGRTGQDLGLTWRAPTIAKSGWGAIVGGFGETAHKKVMGEVQPDSKPLLRILPTGPAHTALKKFRNRTLYSNVVNDGIVPLRTSCLLFLDWQGLGRVEKARREAGLVETVVGFGWAELTGANVTSPRLAPWTATTSEQGDVVGPGSTTAGTATPSDHPDSHEVPQPSDDAILEDDKQSLKAVRSASFQNERTNAQDVNLTATTNNAHPFKGFFDFFKGNETQSKPPPPPNPKHAKIYQRSQTLRFDDSDTTSASSSKSKVTAGHELSEESEKSNGVSAPPRTSFLESATDLINPKLPSVEYLIDPSKRPRAIFHDRVYHPADIPAPPLKKRPASGQYTLRRSSHSSKTITPSVTQVSTTTPPASRVQSPDSPFASPKFSRTDSINDYDDTANTNPMKDSDDVIDNSLMNVEEKIARAYHRDMAWRKVLVKLEPDAHNNIIVRRMFANAFGWPVVKHLVDAHFSDSAAARMRDEDEKGEDRARALHKAPDEHGAETKAQTEGLESATKQDQSIDTVIRPKTRDMPKLRMPSESQVVDDEATPTEGRRPDYDRLDSVTWTEQDWSDTDASEAEDEHKGSHSPAGSDVKGKDTPERSNSPLASAWSWTEKIVGKGSRSNSPKAGQQSSRETKPEDVD